MIFIRTFRRGELEREEIPKWTRWGTLAALVAAYRFKVAVITLLAACSAAAILLHFLGEVP